jgi:hypothetical protein
MKIAIKALLFRLGSILAVSLAALSPLVRWPYGVKDPHVAVVWDESASMAETDTPTGNSRWAEARAVWKKVHGNLSHATVHHYVLGSGIRPVNESVLDSSIPSASESTWAALGADLSTTSVRAILLFSDGRFSDLDKSPPGVPLFVVGMGGGGMTPDVAVESVESPPLAYAGTPVTVTAQLTASLPVSSPVRVGLYENGKPRAQSSVYFSSGSATVSLPFTPARAGLARCEVLVDPVPGEFRTANNVRRFSLEVQRNRVRTLYIAGRPGPHYNFLRAQLKNDPSVELVSFVVLRDPEDVLPYFDAELALIPFPTSAALVAQLPTFDVVVLEEISGIRFGLGDAFFTALEKWVYAGGGFLSIHAPPDLRPLDLRPLDVRPGSEQNFGFLSRLDPWGTTPPVSGPERFRLKVTAPFHPVLSLTDPQTNEARWANLPVLEGTGQYFPGVRPGAHVLAVEPVIGSPVLAERPLGRGRVMGLANTTSWRWALDGGRRGEGPADYQRFWENMVRWLAASPGSGSVRLVRPGGPLIAHELWKVRVHAPKDLSHPPRLWAVSPDEKRQELPVRATERGGEYTADFVPSGAGTYELRAEAGSSDRDHLWVEVSSEWDESKDTRPDFYRLQNVASKSGGVFVEAPLLNKKTFRRWVSRLSWEKRSQGRGVEIFWVVLALLVLFLEWIFRRRQGLP